MAPEGQEEAQAKSAEVAAQDSARAHLHSTLDACKIVQKKPAAHRPNASVIAVPKHNIRANPGKPSCGPKPIVHFEANAAVAVNRTGHDLQEKSKQRILKLKANNTLLMHEKKILKKENKQNMAEIYKLNK